MKYLKKTYKVEEKKQKYNMNAEKNKKQSRGKPTSYKLFFITSIILTIVSRFSLKSHEKVNWNKMVSFHFFFFLFARIGCVLILFSSVFHVIYFFFNLPQSFCTKTIWTQLLQVNCKWKWNIDWPCLTHGHTFSMAYEKQQGDIFNCIK